MKKPNGHLVRLTNASLLAKANPCTQVPDSEIRPENIILGSPEYVPYKWKKPTGKDNGVKNVKISLDMPCQKQTATKAEMEKARVIAHKELVTS